MGGGFLLPRKDKIHWEKGSAFQNQGAGRVDQLLKERGRRGDGLGVGGRGMQRGKFQKMVFQKSAPTVPTRPSPTVPTTIVYVPNFRTTTDRSLNRQGSQ